MRSLHPLPNRGDERGVVAVWLAITLVVLLAFAGWAIDFSHWKTDATRMQRAADAAALAGAVYLPDDPAGAIAAAKTVASQNGYSSGVSVATLDSANQLKVTINSKVKSDFAKVIGISSANISRHAVSEYESPQPLDIVLVIDRTQSMLTGSAAPFTDLKNAALAVLGYLNPKNESIALAVLPPSSTMTQCTGASAGAFGVRATTNPADVGGANTTWMVAPFPANRAPVNDYQLPNGTLNQGSQIVKTINCLQAAGSTDLGDPMAAAGAYLNAYGRPGARKGIMFMTDGGANLPSGTQPCAYANTKATTVKSSGIQVLTIGYLSGTTTCADTTGTYARASVTKLLANMASPIKGVAAVDNSVGCTSNAENTDGDNFFCQPKGGDIKKVFLQAVAQLANRLPRIIQ